MSYPKPLRRLIVLLAKLPGVGGKTATRRGLHMPPRPAGGWGGRAMSPTDGMRPEDLRVRELIGRLSGGGVGEVILATNLTAEGEATAAYLAGAIKPMNIRVTRIAYGMPGGSDLEYTDENTGGGAIKGRRGV